MRRRRETATRAASEAPSAPTTVSPVAPPPPPSVAPTTPTTPAPPAPPVEDPQEGPRRLLLTVWFVVLGLGAAALATSAITGILGHMPSSLDRFGEPPGWLDGAGAVAVVTSLSWLLATRTAGRAVVSAGLALVLGVASLLIGGRVLPTGAAVLTCVVGSVYAVMVTVPAVTWLKAVREAVIATLVATVTAFAAVGFEPTVAAERFDIAALLLALALVFTIVYRLGAGLHGLGRRGLVIVAIGLAVLVATLAYAELLRRYGAQTFVSSVLDFADATSERIGAFPRPLVVLLGIPALVWGTHVRARRRQGWWVCAFGVAATVPLASGLMAPDSSYLEAGLQGGVLRRPGAAARLRRDPGGPRAHRAQGPARPPGRGGRGAPSRAESLRRAVRP